jgi:3-oxoacyl-[acyl-carrier-protein] synthase III
VSLEHTLGSAPSWSPRPEVFTRTAGIAGVGSALPERRVTSAELAAGLAIDGEWIERRTGIRERRYAEPGERVSDLASRAGEAALLDADLRAGEIDLLLVATLAADEITPGAAPIVAHELGAAGAAAMDLGAACTGAIAGLALASAWVQAGHGEHALVIGAEILSRFLDVEDRRTAPLFGDGAGAIVVSAQADGGIGPFAFGSDGAAAQMIRVGRDRAVFEMEGHETFLHAVHRLSSCTREAVELAGLELQEIDLFIYHQANSRILASVAERLELPRERVFDCIASLGNTSAASVPLALGAAVRSGALRPGARVLLGAIGAGLTWGATVVTWGAS